MDLDKDQIVQLLRSKGEHAKADQARSELPAKVDPEKDSGLLSKFGIDPQELLGDLGGGLGKMLDG